MLAGDFDMNSTPQATNSLKDIFKQTMLDQEIIFRKQVCELHRLHSVQKNLMKNHTPLELETFNSLKANAQSFPRETGLPTNSIPMLDSRVSSTVELLEGWQDNSYKFQPSPFNLQRLPDQYTSLVDYILPNKVKVANHLKESIDVNSIHGGDFSDPLELRLSLSLGAIKGNKEDEERSRSDKKTDACSRIVIDLEESTEMTTNVDKKHSSFDAAEVTYSGGKNDSRATINSNPISSGCTMKDLSHKIPLTSPFVGDSNWKKQIYSVQGLKHNDNMPRENLLTRKQQFTSCGVGYVDLNEVKLDDSSCHSDDSILVYPLINSNNEDWRTKDQFRSSVNSPASESRPQINMSKESGGHGGNTKNGRDGLMLKLQNGHAPGLEPACVVAIQSGCEKSGEADNVLFSDKIQITVEDELPDRFSPSGKSSCISDDVSSLVRTMESGIKPCNSNLADSDQFSGTDGRSKVAETLSGEQDQRPSASNEIKHECYDNREESAEVDNLIQIAAESLMHLTSKKSACYQKSSTQTASKESDNEDKEQPQCSHDSYELMTLELAESNADDYSVSSEPFEASDALTKDFGIKLRRGRRLKDFQKDILPGLSSLSRHEIREDINILEGVLRSREYKKMRAKMANGERWFKPVRSRRSRLNYVGRKTFR
ncbi:Flavin-binding monooxygenase family protein [Hibiscus syriacus]|uniref:Flavin-binding monooxygenase family protein n=2 Tax=Hibiscus syriacus TaxID=106335 RepID=A0A6A3B2G7_HIBSY|nr:Flavin-binding monooxygenase family protein [Hibiscus syriacus]